MRVRANTYMLNMSGHFIHFFSREITAAGPAPAPSPHRKSLKPVCVRTCVSLRLQKCRCCGGWAQEMGASEAVPPPVSSEIWEEGFPPLPPGGQGQLAIPHVHRAGGVLLLGWPLAEGS